jgi:hypothetical protein
MIRITPKTFSARFQIWHIIFHNNFKFVQKYEFEWIKFRKRCETTIEIALFAKHSAKDNKHLANCLLSVATI